MSCKIGIPRGLLYYNYYPACYVFLQELGLEIITSSPTNREIVDRGIQLAPEELCLPFKTFFGHASVLAEKVDYLFIPRVIDLGKYNKICPKFMGLPDLISSLQRSYKINNQSQIISPLISITQNGRFSIYKEANKLGKKFNKNRWIVERAYWKAKSIQNRYIKLQEKGYTPQEGLIKLGLEDSANRIDYNSEEKPKIKLGLLGHSYLTADSYLNLELIKRLKSRNIEIKTVEMIPDQVLEKEASRSRKKLYWIFNRKILGAAYHYIYNQDTYDGFIHLTSFGCGPDSMVEELINTSSKEKQAYLHFNLDEHSGEAGFITRLEAFLDLLERKKGKYEKDHLSSYGKS